LNFFFRLSFFSFSFLFAAVIDLLLGLLGVKKLISVIETGNFYMEQPGVVAGNFAPSFSLNILSIFMHNSGAIRRVTLIWVSLERCFPPAQLSIDDVNFGQKGRRQKWKKGRVSSRPVTAGTGVNG